MPKLVAVRDSQMRTTIAQVPIKVAREMVDRNEAEWTGNSRSIRLVRKKRANNQDSGERTYSRRGLSCIIDGSVIESYVLAKCSGADDAAIPAIDAPESWRGQR